MYAIQLLLSSLYLFFLYSLNLRLVDAEITNTTMYGIPVESHTVTTDDGYILQMFHIPAPQPNNMVYFLMHDIMCSSDDFFIGGNDSWVNAIPVYGVYDIWLGNARGNKYSLGHTSLNASIDNSYWNFSFHEIGVYDLPSMIDYIFLNVTDVPQIIYYYGIGQGAAALYIMLSMPDYQSKVFTSFAIAPIVFLGNVSSPYIKTISHEFIENQTLVEEYDHKEFKAKEFFLDGFGRSECKETTNNSAICDNIYFLITSYDSSYNYSDSEKSFILSHTPTTCSTKQLLHYAQLVVSGRFAEYDYGTEMNMIIYNKPTPPDYNLEHTNSVYQPVFFSVNDLMTSELDINHFITASNIPMSFVDMNCKISHFDFMNLSKIVNCA